MGTEKVRADDRDRAPDALQNALAASFAAQRLSGQSLAYFYGSALPSLVLWVHSRHPLPDLVAWVAVFGWAMCAVLTVALAVAATRRRAQARAALPEANQIARVHLAPSEGMPSSSTLLFFLSAAASALLWLRTLAPPLIRPDVLALDSTIWPVLVVGALLSRYFERASLGEE
jgi:hypothetical protein